MIKIWEVEKMRNHNSHYTFPLKQHFSFYFYFTQVIFSFYSNSTFDVIFYFLLQKKVFFLMSLLYFVSNIFSSFQGKDLSLSSFQGKDLSLSSFQGKYLSPSSFQGKDLSLSSF